MLLSRPLRRTLQERRQWQQGGGRRRQWRQGDGRQQWAGPVRPCRRMRALRRGQHAPGRVQAACRPSQGPQRKKRENRRRERARRTHPGYMGRRESTRGRRRRPRPHFPEQRAAKAWIGGLLSVLLAQQVGDRTHSATGAVTGPAGPSAASAGDWRPETSLIIGNCLPLSQKCGAGCKCDPAAVCRQLPAMRLPSYFSSISVYFSSGAMVSVQGRVCH